MEFSDYIVNYPLQDDPDIQYKTSRSLEFYELKGKAKEPVPEKGEFFNHQNLFTRYLRTYDRIINIHETGTGKTGSIINAAEMFKNDRSLGIDRVIIILPGGATLDDFKTQIIKFFPEYDDKSLTMSNKKINKWYSLETYETFAKNINSMTNDVIRETYSDTLFFLDEAHRLRNYIDSKTNLNIYDYLWRLFHIADRTKIVVATATPLVNSTNDFIPLANLLLSENNQLPSTWDYDKVSLKQLEPYLRGKITFVRGLDTGVNVLESGSNITMKYSQNFPIEEDTFSPIPPVSKKIIIDNKEPVNKYKIISTEEPQQEVLNTENITITFNTRLSLIPMSYKNKTPTLQQKSYLESIDTKSPFNANERQASIFVFPDGSYGSDGFKKYVKRQGDKYVFKEKFMDKKGIEQKGVLQYINKDVYSIFNFSSKFWFYISNEMKLKGNSFCYIESVTGSGLIVLELLLEYYGFQKYNATTSLNLAPKKRFAVITGDTKNINSILKVFNSPENKNGDYIQMIVASEVARDGINLSNVVRGYLMTPTWHESGSHQALSRFIRATSHQELLKNQENVEIKIYKLCSCTDVEYIKTTEFNPTTLENLTRYSVDVKNYIKSGIKDISNKQMMQKFKNIAFDGVLNYERNYNRASDKDYSKKLDFNIRTPEMWSDVNVNPNEIVKNRKFLLFNDKNLNIIHDFVIDSLNIEGAVTLSQIKEFISDKFENIYLYLYLDTMVNKIDIKDKFGNKINVKFHGSVIYTDSYSDYIYNLNVKNYIPKVKEIEFKADVSEIDKFKEKLKDKSYESVEKIIRDYIWVTDNKGKGIESEINKRYNVLRLILEHCIVKLRSKTTDSIEDNIIKVFRFYIGKVDYPYEDVKKTEDAFKKEVMKSGRKAAQTSRTRLKGIKYNTKKDTNSDTVYYHWFAKVSPSKVADIYNMENDMRLLPRDSNNFRDTTENEKYVFYSYMDEDREKMFMNYNGKNFGSMFRDSKFRLHIFKEGVKNKGTECKNNKTTIIKFFISVIDKTKDKFKIRELLDQTSVDLLNDETRLFNHIDREINKTSLELCNILKEFLKYKKLLISSV